MNTPEITYCPSALLNLGVVIRIKSHNARRNTADRAPSLRGLLSIKWALWGRHHAADGYYSVSEQDAERLRAEHGRWSRSVSFPKRVPADLAHRTGGIFG